MGAGICQGFYGGLGEGLDCFEQWGTKEKAFSFQYFYVTEQLPGPYSTEEVYWSNDRDTLVQLEFPEMAIPRDDQVCFSFHCTLQNPVIRQVVFYHAKDNLGSHQFTDLGKQL
jgi:hypothetical protein